MNLPRLAPVKPLASPTPNKAVNPIDNKVITANWSLLRKDDFGSKQSNTLIKSSFKNYSCPKHFVKDPKVKDHDFLMIFDPKSLSITYDKLDQSKAHKLTLHLVSPGGNRNINVLINGHTIEQNFDLAKNQLIIKDLYIKSEHIKNNQIKLDIQKNSGANAVLSYTELYEKK